MGYCTGWVFIITNDILSFTIKCHTVAYMFHPGQFIICKNNKLHRPPIWSHLGADVREGCQNPTPFAPFSVSPRSDVYYTVLHFSRHKSADPYRVSCKNCLQPINVPAKMFNVDCFHHCTDNALSTEMCHRYSFLNIIIYYYKYLWLKLHIKVDPFEGQLLW